jgi:hypothetical protein
MDSPVVAGQRIAAEKPVITAPAEIKKRDVEAATPHSLERIRHIPVTLHATEIPIVPARVVPKVFLYRPAPPKQRIRGPSKSYKVAFQSGPKLWRTASVMLALLLLAGLIATVVIGRPPVAPGKPRAVTNANPPVFLPSAEASAADSSNRPAPAASSPVGGGKTIAGKASVPASQNPPAAAARHRSASDDGLIAEDTVVFYNRKPPHHEAKLPPPPSDVKRHSD